MRVRAQAPLAGAWPRVTGVVNLACGPSVRIAATAVATLVVEAGVKPLSGSSEYKTCPLVRLTTSAPACWPRPPESSSPDNFAATPAGAGDPEVAAPDGSVAVRRNGGETPRSLLP